MDQSTTRNALTSQDFKAIADIAFTECGITLVEEKAKMVQSRLRHRLAALQLKDFASYCSYLHSEIGHQERKQVISALTTNVSHFFREKHHFDLLVEAFQRGLPDLRSGRPFRVWSAGSANGQEALTAAICLSEVCPDLEALDLLILGTDIDYEVVKFARRAKYPERLMRGISAELKKKYFIALSDSSADGEVLYQPVEKIRKIIRFNELNLHAKWPMQRKFDVIFCRNVVIYFDGQTQNALWSRFREVLAPDGYVFLGHSERMADPTAHGFRIAGPTVYEAA